MKNSKHFSRPKPSGQSSPDEATINALIHKGGSVATSATTTDAIKRVQLRLPVEMQERIDTVRQHCRIKCSRHTWILEAIMDKLEQEEG